MVAGRGLGAVGVRLLDRTVAAGAVDPDAVDDVGGAALDRVGLSLRGLAGPCDLIGRLDGRSGAGAAALAGRPGDLLDRLRRVRVVSGRRRCAVGVGLMDRAVVARAVDADGDRLVRRLDLERVGLGIRGLLGAGLLRRLLGAAAVLGRGLAGRRGVAGLRDGAVVVGLMHVAVVTLAVDPDGDRLVARVLL